MTQEELKRYIIPVKYNGMIIGSDMVDYPKTIHVTPICIGTGCSEVGLALTTDGSRKQYVDLSQVWHDISDPPTKLSRILVLFSNGKAIVWRSCSGIAQQFNEHNAIEWAYIDDLLPKGK